MAGGMFTNNTTLKVSSVSGGTVSNSISSATTIYTCSANSYALVNLGSTAGAQFTVQIGGRTVAVLSGTAGTGLGCVGTAGSTPSQGFIVGPSQAVAISSYTSGTLYISGVEFVNSP